MKRTEPGEITEDERMQARDEHLVKKERQRIRAEKTGETVARDKSWDRANPGTATDQPAITAEDIAVRYKVRGVRRGRFARRTEEVTALDGVSLTINRGEAFGLIGRNGAGKTTLIKVLAGTMPPDRGRVITYGAVPAMLGMGVGFNRKLSGRRNVYLGALASGMRLHEAEEVFDDIVEFAELGRAIDRPVETYSAGMYARLGFAIAIQSRPNFLLVDEALTVGDEGFKQKSKAAMEEILGQAGTIVIVSHGVGKMRQFCDRVAWLDEGKLIMVGESNEVINAYREFLGVTGEDEDDDADGGLEAGFLQGDDLDDYDGDVF